MTKLPNDPLTRATADRLLEGTTADVPQLARLLRAAAAPAAGTDLAGQQAVLAAFRHARELTTPTRPRRLTMIKSAVLAALSAKTAAAAAVAAAATGGIALAASSGVLPTSHTGGSHPASNSSHAPAGSPTTATSHASAEPSPSPNLHGLCTAYRAGATSNPGKAASNPAFSALARAAGGASNIAGYCATVAAPQDSVPTSGHPTGKPSSLPTHANTTHPTGKPTALPSQVPTSHPTGAPSPMPSHPTGPPTHH